MGWLDRWRRKPAGIELRCGMCGRIADYPTSEHDKFLLHSCDADVLVRGREEATGVDAALDLFVSAFAKGGELDEAGREAARDRLLYESGEGSIPALEDLLFRMKYVPRESWPFPELAARCGPEDDQLRIDWSNELEMYLHRMKKYAITARQLEATPESARPILRDKLERLKTEPLEPIED